MSDLIKITTKDGKQLVSARELHEFLEIKTKYKDWFPRMVEYGFEEGIDFVKVAQKRATNNLKNPVTTIIDCNYYRYGKRIKYDTKNRKRKTSKIILYRM